LAEHTLTVLFADIADSTGMAEKLGPKRFGNILATYYQAMTEVIFSHGGMVDKFLGDGIMAIFGMGGDRQDPEGRAVAAGLKMLDVLDELNQSSEEPISLGLGINTGVVVMWAPNNSRINRCSDTVKAALRIRPVRTGCSWSSQ
jgi:adenylate cyclase